jgi:hypothetical protein
MPEEDKKAIKDAVGGQLKGPPEKAARRDSLISEVDKKNQ